MSHPAKTTSESLAIGTSSSMRGVRLSVRLPSRTVPIWVRLPTGRESPVRIASTPAMNVVATAPIPGRRMPSLPSAGAIVRPRSLPVLMRGSPAACFNRPRKNRCYHSERGGPRARSVQGARAVHEPAGAAEEVQGGRGQLAVVAGSDEALLPHVVVEDAGAGQVLLRLEGVEHQDPRVARKPAVVEEPELEIPHRHVRSQASLGGRFAVAVALNGTSDTIKTGPEVCQDRFGRGTTR